MQDFNLDNKEDLTNEMLLEFIKKHQTQRIRYDRLMDDYLGKFEILMQDRKSDYKPDNRIVVNFAKYIVDTFNGFFIGIPLRITSDNENVNSYIQELERLNNLDDVHYENSKFCSIYGHSYELIFLDENANVGITYIPPTEAFLIYDNSIRERILFGIRYTKNKKGEIEGTISDDNSIKYFRNTENGLIFEFEKPNYFRRVPIVEYVENEERQSAFENVETLIDSYNKALSEKANDIDYFADAYLLILGCVLEDKNLEQIKRNRILNLARAGDIKDIVVKFLEKPNADQTQENYINRLEKQIFAMSMVSNINDENFGQSSGIALKYKLQSMGNLANNKERKFVKSLNDRFDIISNLPNSKISKEDLKTINYKFTRNIPNNILEEAQTANQLDGLISNETILENLSIVENAKNELEKMKEESKIKRGYDFQEADINE